MYDVSMRKISCEKRFVKPFRWTEKLKCLPCIYGKKDRMLDVFWRKHNDFNGPPGNELRKHICVVAISWEDGGSEIRW